MPSPVSVDIISEHLLVLTLSYIATISIQWQGTECFFFFLPCNTLANISIFFDFVSSHGHFFTLLSSISSVTLQQQDNLPHLMHYSMTLRYLLCLTYSSVWLLGLTDSPSTRTQSHINHMLVQHEHFRVQGSWSTSHVVHLKIVARGVFSNNPVSGWEMSLGFFILLYFRDTKIIPASETR